MKKFVLSPDSFKGTLTAREVCQALEEAIAAVYPEAEVVSLPVADGGEGSVEAFLAAAGGQRITTSCTGPNGQRVEATYALLPDKTAVIEVAAAAGLPLASPQNPEETTTYGVGELMADAAERGATGLLLCLGGSATNDGGCGAAAACGVRFYDEGGNCFAPTGGNLGKIARIDLTGLRKRVAQLPVVTLCDVDTPLWGEEGAAAVFAPQKGADQAMVARLDQGLRHLGRLLERDCGVEVATLPGGGAAGGMGAGMAAFFRGRIQMGVEAVLDAVGFEEKLQGADLVFTGEGRLDGQSLRGKVVAGVARRAKAQNVAVVALVGDVGEDLEELYDLGVTAVCSINRVALPYQQARSRSRRDLRATAEDLLRLCRRVEIGNHL